eukprot:gnl/TRDRNA2_/TRDRNA2_164315_c2_seq2.p1 gnl/TRDRNA2_/TRDRNA2_164315_c2~~gnl/TRDRNA2_/TRDRNA2_164315_c2_seq2.p1  ORF type:complete len:173 (+),score=35.98 gnl/TRDRNA2_/TRDRNA2_164315_c2_seq2:2-520(+)
MDSGKVRAVLTEQLELRAWEALQQRAEEVVGEAVMDATKELRVVVAELRQAQNEEACEQDGAIPVVRANSMTCASTGKSVESSVATLHSVPADCMQEFPAAWQTGAHVQTCARIRSMRPCLDEQASVQAAVLDQSSVAMKSGCRSPPPGGRSITTVGALGSQFRRAEGLPDK